MNKESFNLLKESWDKGITDLPGGVIMYIHITSLRQLLTAYYLYKIKSKHDPVPPSLSDLKAYIEEQGGDTSERNLRNYYYAIELLDAIYELSSSK